MNVARHGFSASLLALTWLSGFAGCAGEPTAFSHDDDESAVTLTVLSAFLQSEGTGPWPIIYVSDQYVTFELDSAFLDRLPHIGATYLVATRAEAEERPDIVRNNGLLLEPLAAIVQPDRSVLQPLNFSANSHFGGSYVYRLTRFRGQWRIVAVSTVWVI